MSGVPVAYQCLKIIPCAQVSVSLAIVVCGSGAELVSIAESCGVLELSLVLINFARRQAPSAFTSPVPCSNMLYPAMGSAVYINAIFTMFGVRLGLICNINAAIPETTGVAIEVPLKYISRLLSELLTPASSDG